jgi:hypothetical protein
MSLPFNKTPINDKTIQDINSTYEALTCSTKATEKNELEARTFGTISPNLCNICTNIFQRNRNRNGSNGDSVRRSTLRDNGNDAE